MVLRLNIDLMELDRNLKTSFVTNNDTALEAMTLEYKKGAVRG